MFLLERNINTILQCKKLIFNYLRVFKKRKMLAIIYSLIK
ncbi:hypothetical protein A1OE_964 [Candidatus Endolissoclinum faulkneri L2]|uniref:Uncharacterized protein n=1 Tax=Candidatus Endolissoclinum faulkneri L2 TaxID=1193729 RepID=K7YHS7_9PROT|nr:hypothetical protein A1OE_964 [Candidatus Endolissoclinum faulkneri L2]